MGRFKAVDALLDEDPIAARVTRAFIPARLRRAQDYPSYRSFLEALPTESIAARARATVTRRIDELIARHYSDGD